MAVTARRRRIRRALSVAVAAVAVFVVVLIALIVGGVLIIPSGSGPAPITVRYVTLVIQQGNTSSGVPWFGPSPINFTSGFPIQVAPGANFSIVWLSFFNFDSINHTINRVSPSSPFTLVSTWPTIPYLVPYDSEGHNLAIWMKAPSTPGATYAVTVVVTATTEG